MEETHETRETDSNKEQCACGAAREGTCYVLMHSAAYGTEVWPCAHLEEGVRTLARLAHVAEQQRREDGIQRYFCLWSETPAQGQALTCDPVSPDRPDTEALTLTLHFRAEGSRPNQEARTCRCEGRPGLHVLTEKIGEVSA